MKSIKLFFIIFFAILLLFCFGCSNSSDEEIPEEVTEFLNTYLEAYQEGPEVSVEYVYFLPENSIRYQYYRDAGDWLEEYVIHDSIKVNDDLYGFLITFTTNAAMEGYIQPSTAWNYVAKVDGEWRIITSSDNIPEDIQDNYNADDFSVPDEYMTISEEDIINEEDILGSLN